MKKAIIGLDIGGTKMEGGLYLDGVEVSKIRVPTQREEGYNAVMRRMGDLIHSLLREGNTEKENLQGIGIGLPGTMNPQTDLMINGNSEIFIGKNVKEDLKKIIGFKGLIRVANDANLFALAEVYNGAGKYFEREFGKSPTEQIAIGIILGTGNGGGLILDGKIYEGRHGGGAEVGHHVLIHDGRSCYCGRKGCAEQYLAGPSIERSYFERTGEKKKATEVFSLTDEVALKVQERYIEYLTDFLANLATLFDPDYFVLGGGVSTIPLLYKGTEELLWNKVFLKGTKPKIYRHGVADSAGMLGAAMLFE